MLPKVTIKYLNGLLGTVPDSQDGLLALVLLGASPVGETFVEGVPYRIYGVSSLEDLGVTEENNARLVKIVQEFYAEASEGTPLYVVGYASAVSMTAFCNKDTGKIVELVESLKGAVRGIVVAGTAETAATEGVAADVLTAVPLAQAAAEHCAESLYAPVFVILEGRAFADAAKLPDMTEQGYNRVAVVLGDTAEGSKDAAVGLLAGRIASVPIQRNIGAVLSGPLNASQMYIGSVPVDRAMDAVRTAHDKGYIVPRIHIGRPGYYYADDVMCCDQTDDYAHLTARRTIDKAARIAYDTLIDYLLSEIEVNEDGTMQQPVVKGWQASVESAIDAQMTAAGELSAVNGSGCRCLIDASQNVLATGVIEVTVKVLPYGYAREIVAKIGFLTNNA
ncbi:MAG: hypothetical protein IJ307_05840 [Bacteroidales bacterium]|nr:hypothetical protein [Bacteroidales bacterium]